MISFITSVCIFVATPGREFTYPCSAETKHHLGFTDIMTFYTFATAEVVIPLINDDIAGPRKSFICIPEGGHFDSVRAIFPSQVRIDIHHDDGEHMHGPVVRLVLYAMYGITNIVYFWVISLQS